MEVDTPLFDYFSADADYTAFIDTLVDFPASFDDQLNQLPSLDMAPQQPELPEFAAFEAFNEQPPQIDGPAFTNPQSVAMTPPPTAQPQQAAPQPLLAAPQPPPQQQHEALQGAFDPSQPQYNTNWAGLVSANQLKPKRQAPTGPQPARVQKPAPKAASEKVGGRRFNDTTRCWRYHDHDGNYRAPKQREALYRADPKAAESFYRPERTRQMLENAYRQEMANQAAAAAAAAAAPAATAPMQHMPNLQPLPTMLPPAEAQAAPNDFGGRLPSTINLAQVQWEPTNEGELYVPVQELGTRGGSTAMHSSMSGEGPVGELTDEQLLWALNNGMLGDAQPGM